MIGRVLRVTKAGGVVQGTISTQNGTEYKFFNPSIYVRPKFIVEFNIVESDGTEFAQLIKQAEIEYPQLSIEEVQSIIAEVTKAIESKGYLTALEFSQMLKENRILDVKIYARNMTTFISKYLAPSYIARTDIMVNGKICPCAIVPYTAKGKLEFGDFSTDVKALDGEKIRNIITIIKQYLKEHDYIKGAHFPALLKKAGIADFHQYADSISAFVSSYVNSEFKVETNVYIDGKTQPCIITDIKKDAIEDIKNELLTIIEENGFADFALFTELFENYHINVLVLTSSFSKFVEQELEGLEIQDDVVINQMYYKRVLMQKERVSYVSVHDYDGELTIRSEVILNISQEISSIIKADGFMHSSELPVVFKRCGVVDYKVYAASLSQFVEKYLIDFEPKINAYIDGKNYPAIIVERGQEIPFFSGDDAYILNICYESGDYYGFLSSEHFTKYRPVDIPPTFFQKALTCAKRLLTKDTETIFTPNSFQKTLLDATLGVDIIKKYKKDGVIDKEALEECFCTSIPQRSITNKKERDKVAKGLFNAVGQLAARTHNTDYIGLIERAESCMNELYPYLVLIRIIISSGRKYELLNELCRRVKYASRAKGVSDLTLSSPENWLYIPTIISVCEEHGILEEPPRIFLNQLFSIFVDLNALDEIAPVSHLFAEKMFKYFFELYNHYEELTEDDYRNLFTESINKELYQKIAAQLWERIGYVDILPSSFLKLLSFTLKYDCEESVDEILRLRINGGTLTKKEKRLILLSSYSAIIDLLKTDAAFYGLGVYAKKCYHDLSEAALTITMRQNWEQWENVANNYYVQRTYALFPVTDENANIAISLFDVFKLDFTYEICLQNGYADWILAHYDFDKALNEIETDLYALYKIHAYEAFHRIYARSFSNCLEKTNKELTAEYINSLVALHLYEEALTFVIENDLHDHLLHIAVDICDHCGISEQTRYIFNKAWSLEEALTFVFRNYTANATYVINTLVVLYCLMDTPFNAIYLYACYENTIVRGHSHIHTQFLRWLGNRFTKVVNDKMTRYSVIEKAFFYLPTEQLIDFLAWCGDLKLPEKVGQTKMQTHTFAANYEFLIKHTRDPLKWRAFYDYIIKRPNLNAWKLCVCANVISFLESRTATEFADTAIQMAENHLALVIEDIPYNFLNMICPFVSIIGTDSLFRKILNAMIQSDDFKNRICISPITQKENYAVLDFVRICANRFNEKNEDVYFDLIERIDGQENLFTLIDISRLFAHDEGRITILRHLCKVYGKVEDTREYRNILYNEHWNALGYIESNLLSVVRFLYNCSDEMLEEFVPSSLNHSEHNFTRIKNDVAEILSCYPSKHKLFHFDAETFSVPYKMLVYSIVASVLYDQDLYSNYFNYRYVDLKALNAFGAFAFFAYKVYLFQVYHNCDFDLFYIERRYQKALLALSLMEPTISSEAKDSLVVSSMEFFGHKELSYQTKYLPFKNALLSFMHDPAELKASENSIMLHELFLFSLLSGDFCEFFDECLKYPAEVISQLSLNEMKLMISEIALREFSISAFRYYHLHQDSIDLLLEISKHISKPVHDVLDFLHAHSDPRSHELFIKLTQAEKPSACVANILKVSTKEFDSYSELLIPLLASVQLPLRLYEKLYSLVTKGDTNDRYLSVLLYIANEYPQSKTVYCFLRCAQAAICKDIDTLNEYYNELDFKKNLPETWNNAYLALKHYMLSNMSERFIPPIMDGDSSFRSIKNSKFRFIDAISRLLRIQPSDALDIEELYAAYRTSKTDKKTELGIQLLHSMSKTFNKRGLPSYHETVYMVGMDMLGNELEFTPEVRILILADLYIIVNMLSIKNQRDFFKLSKKWVDKLLQDGLDLNCWCEYYDLICTFISTDDETRKELDAICEQIVPILRNVMQSDYPLDQRFAELSSLQIATVFYTRFAGYLQKAVEREIKRLEKGIRLHIEIVNDSCTDGCIYAQILNIGQSTVNLRNKGENYVRIALSFDDNPNESVIQTDTITELRHGYVSGFCVKLPFQVENISSIDVTVSAWINHVLYSRCRKVLRIDQEQNTVNIELQRQWYNVESAVTDEEMLFGREDDKERLRQSLKDGVTVLYGPSRIGKTSLLNWVRRFLSSQNVNSPDLPTKRIITVLLAGEGSSKEHDYIEKFFDRTQKLDYTASSDISEYLLSESIIHSFDKSRRFAVVGKALTHDLKNQIIAILSDYSFSLEDRYSNLEDLLREHDTELWLLMDEFQQVVQRWNQIDRETSPFALVCSDLKVSNSEYPHTVRLVLCGSDDLLKQMTSTDNSVWRKIIPNTGVLVGSLPKDGFRKMICEAEGFPKELIHYSPSAIDALYTYTGGIALYGKEICNTILRRLCRDTTFFTHRNTIFSSDVSWAVQTLLNRQEHEQESNKSVNEGIVHIYDAVVKNLDDKTDKLFLMYIAQWMRENISCDSFPKSRFTNMRLKTIYADKIDDSIEIAVKRGILREQENANGIVCAYTFTTVFYYYAFLGINKMSCEQIENILINDSNDSAVAFEQETTSAFTEVREGFACLSPDDKYDILSLAYLDTSISSEKMSEFRKRVTSDTINNAGMVTFINHIEDYMEKAGIDMGLDSNVTYNINGNQVNVANDNATINATQNNGIDDNELKKFMDSMRVSLSEELSDEDKKDAKECIDIIEQELQSNNPSEETVKTRFKLLKRIDNSVKFISACASVATFANRFYPFLDQIALMFQG